MAERLVQVKGTKLSYQSHSNVEHLLEGSIVAGAFNGVLKVKGIYLHYMDHGGVQRRLLGILTGNTGIPGKLWNKGDYLFYIDNNGDERYIGLGGLGANIDSIDYTTWDVFHQTVKVYDNLGVCVWMGPNLPVYMSSYSIDSEGYMSDEFLYTHNIYIGDSYAFPTGSILVGPGIVATVFAQWVPYITVLKTHKVETDGSISHIDTEIITGAEEQEEYHGGSRCDIVHVSGTTYAILAKGGENGEYGKLRTYTIGTDGVIGTRLDEAVMHGKKNPSAAICHMGNGIVVVARESLVGENHYGLKLHSFSINEAGAITAVSEKTIYAEMERNSHEEFLIAVNSGILMGLFYRNIWETSTPSFCFKTIAMTGGSFGAVIETKDVLPIGADQHIIHIGGDIFMYAFRGAPSSVRTVAVTAEGAISDTISEKAPGGGYDTWLMHQLGSLYTMNYASTISTHGLIVSFMVG